MKFVHHRDWKGPESTAADAWLHAMRRLAEAERARQDMQDASLPWPARDEATAEYVRATDDIVAVLGGLRRRGVLERVGRWIRNSEA
ncbi:MAG: hypothetical protein MUE98_04215 [Rhodobacteraceae bacterium]|nr:hypothetical protein [Paracoccaceae bacterium]